MWWHNTTHIVADWTEFDRLVHPEEITAYIIDDVSNGREEDTDQKPDDKGDQYFRDTSVLTLFSRRRLSRYEIGR